MASLQVGFPDPEDTLPGTPGYTVFQPVLLRVETYMSIMVFGASLPVTIPSAPQNASLDGPLRIAAIGAGETVGGVRRGQVEDPAEAGVGRHRSRKEHHAVRFGWRDQLVGTAIRQLIDDVSCRTCEFGQLGAKKSIVVSLPKVVPHLLVATTRKW